MAGIPETVCCSPNCVAPGTTWAGDLPYCAAHHAGLPICPGRNLEGTRCGTRIPMHHAGCREHRLAPIFNDDQAENMGALR